MVDQDGYNRSLGEVARRLDEVFSRFEQVASDLPKTFVSRELMQAKLDVANAEHEKVLIAVSDQARRIKELEDDKTWLYRLVIGAVIMALIGLALGVSHGVGSTGSTHTGQSQVSTR